MADIGTQLATAYPTAPVAATTGGSSSSTETPRGATKKNPLGIEAGPLKTISDADQAIETGVGAEGEAGVDVAKIKAEAAESGETELQKQQGELQALVDAHRAEYQKELERAKPIFDQADKFQFHQYWADKGTADGVLAAISSALLGFGTGQYHNVAMDMAEKEHQREVSELNGIMERAKMSGANLEELRKMHQDAEQALSVMHLGRYKAIMAQYDKMAAQAGIPSAVAEASVGKATAQRNAANAWLEYDKTLRTRAARSVSERIKPAPNMVPQF